MHYANGRAAKVGDLVRGKGYNIKHEIVGLLIGANPAATTCNCTVATVTSTSQVTASVYRDPSAESPGKFRLHDGSQSLWVQASFEYGQLDGFVAIDPSTGEVLAPESPLLQDAKEATASA
jgi:hypothetical protein